MKKIAILMLIVCLFVPAVSFSSTEDELVGTWVGSSEFYQGEVNYYLVRLYEDHSALYEISKIEKFEIESFSNVYNGTWELKEDGVHVYYKNLNKESKELLLELTQAHYLAIRLAVSYVMLVKLPPRKEVGSFHTVSSWDD